MKKRNLIAFIGLTIACSLFFSQKVSAHELYIEVDEFTDSEELRVDIKWGHIRDYVDPADVEDYQLHVRYPNEDVEQLDLEESGVYARAYVPIEGDGDYVFWAERKPSTYEPDDSVTQLSNQMAKHIHHVGDGSSTANEAVETELEVIPTMNTANFSTGNFSGTIILDGDEVNDATVTAYGPEFEILETVSADDGTFDFTFDSTGEWLIRVNVEVDEPGSIEGEEYELISHTSTLLIDTEQTAEEEAGDSNIWSLVSMSVIGLLIGASIGMLILRRK